MRLAAVIISLIFGLPAFAGVSAWIPFDSDGGHISIPVVLNGEETRAILDSGAAGNAISERFLAGNDGGFSYGKQIIVEGVHGTRKVRFVNGVDINMFDTSLQIDKLIPVRIHSADLIIGLPFFEHFILQIDYPAQRLRIISADTIDLKEFANVKMKRSGHSHPMVKVELNNEYNAWLTLDTGNNTGIFMPRNAALRYGWLDRYGTAQSLVAGVTKVSANDTFNLPTMNIGPFTLENVIVMVPAEGNKTMVGRESLVPTGTRIRKATSDGILGYDVLKHFIVTIDFNRSLLHMAPPADE